MGDWGDERAGYKFGRLTLVRRAGRGADGVMYWECECSCGRRVAFSFEALRKNRNKSCGCLASNPRPEFSPEQLQSDINPYYAQQASAASKPKRSRCRDGDGAFVALFRAYATRAKGRGLAFDLSPDQFRDLTSAPCDYCGTPPNQISRSSATAPVYRYNGIDRVDNDTGYTLENSRTSCVRCNFAKGASREVDFVAWLDALVDHRTRQKFRKVRVA